MNGKKRKIAMITISILLLAVVSVFFMMGKFSARQTPLGVGSEQDFICGSNPNCVSSVGVQTSRQSVEPLNLAGLENAERSLLNAVRATGGQIRNIDAGMLTAEYKSTVFGFVDDVLIKIDDSGQRADIISRSRVGYSDFGVNRKRVEKVRDALVR